MRISFQNTAAKVQKKSHIRKLLYKKNPTYVYMQDFFVI